MALQRKDASQLDGDQPGRRKPFVIVASVLMAVSMAIPLISPTLIALFIQTVLAALAGGYGMVWVVALVLVLVAAAVFVPVKRVR